ncbi:HD domain-containing phosphohydrolase [Geopsychrobacter electrodiphilus]|uniref:HD domain-containing phosphohydrolase n=1 Tax=Geopsychrobacter electrodiphilus TaxID=225196 RepID=UPI00036406A7|nr:HD domain-containing phosphohydrolase [Geopsychrobacter electrodiphilus]
MDSAALYNSRIIDTYLKLLAARYPHVDTKEILRHAGMESYEVADQGHWFTQNQVDLFHEKCVQLTGNEHIAREAGRFAATLGTLGTMRHYILSMSGPLRAFALIGGSTQKFVRSSDYSSRKIGNTKVEITVIPRPESKEKPFQCDNRIGFFEAIINIFNLHNHQIEHPECIFKGGKKCRYIISWSQNRITIIRRLRDATVLLGVITTATSFFLDPLTAVRVVLPGSTVAGLLSAWFFEYIRSAEREKGMAQLWDISNQLTEQIDHNYRNTQLAAEVGDVVVNQTSIKDVIESVVHVLQNKLDYDRGLFLLADEKEAQLEICGAYGYNEQHHDILTNISFKLNNPNSLGMFVVSYREQKPFLINDVTEIMESLSPRSRQFMQTLGTQSFICVPIVFKGKSIGVLAVDNLKTKRPLVVSDINLLMGITPAIAVSIQNARLLEARAAQFESTLLVLAGSIDARDFLTAGHSEQVAEYANGIAEELGLNEEECRVIRLAALLHDYGKIGIEDSILKKSGPLTEKEHAIIRTHPTKTRRILEKVAFEGPYQEIPEMCESHHEKWDGTGYPNALKGKEIPLGARIIAVADFYEAITAERHYRDPMSRTEALKVFRSEIGKHFQPKIAEAFLRCLKRGTVRLPFRKNGAEQTKINFREKPHHHRIAYRSDISAKAGQRVITGTSVNISAGGMYINSPQAIRLAPENEIQITFTLPGKNELVQLLGTVAWINIYPQPNPQLPEGFGVKFGNIDPKTHKIIQKYIATRLDSARRTSP